MILIKHTFSNQIKIYISINLKILQFLLHANNINFLHIVCVFLCI